MDKKIKVIVVDDHDLFREGLISLIENETFIEIIGEATDWSSLHDLLSIQVPDILLLDIMLPGKSGIEIAEIVHQNYPEVKTIILSANTDENSVFSSINAGINGYLPKSTSKTELLEALNQVNSGNEYYSDSISLSIFKNYLRFAKTGRKITKDREISLTDREKQIICLFAEGLSYKEIAAKLDISVRTVESHKNNIFEKLELKTIVDLVKYAIRTGLSCA